MNARRACTPTPKINRNRVLHIRKTTESRYLCTDNFVAAFSHPHRMNNHETQPRPASDNDYSAVSNTFNPSVQVNPTIHVSAGNTRKQSRPLRGVLLTLMLLLALAVGGIIIKNTLFSNQNPAQEDYHQPKNKALRIN
ncbi:MAG: hypothetical protein IM638_01865 [Bacteroidetes bacterium]|nr:hypothetical protein [Bacteroidota bacterium]